MSSLRQTVMLSMFMLADQRFGASLSSFERVPMNRFPWDGSEDVACDDNFQYYMGQQGSHSQVLDCMLCHGVP